MEKVKTGAYVPLPIVPIVLVGAVVDGIVNYTTAAFVSGINVNPPILCVSLNKHHHTPKGMIQNGTFSINIPSSAFVAETDYCGLVSGREIDKSDIFTSFYGELKTAPMIQEFPITCECRYTGQKMEFPMDTACFGEVIQVHVNEDLLLQGEKIDIRRAVPLCYSGLENRYCALGEDLGQGWGVGKRYEK